MPGSDAPWTVLVVDDSTAYLDAMRAWLATRSEFQVAGAAENGREAVLAIETLDPDLVLMDAVMPVLDGFEATRQLREAGDDRWIVLVSFHDSTPVRQEAWAAGADGFVSKADLIETLPRMVRNLAAGRTAEGGEGPRGGRGVRPSGDRGSRPAPGPEPGTTERRARDEERPVRRWLRRLGLERWRRSAGMASAWGFSGVGGGSRFDPSGFRNREE